jgi:hypothetical protein
MTSSPDRPLRAAEIHANTMRAFKTSAYSDDGYRRKQGGSNACYPKSNMQAARQLFET